MGFSFEETVFRDYLLEQEADRERMGSYVYVHGYLSFPRGIRGHVFHEQLPDGHQEIHVRMSNAVQDSV